MTTIDKIVAFAEKAHEGQRRKYADEPYIAHPVRVMRMCANYSSEECVLYAAVLHDVIEDTSVDMDQLQVFLNSVLYNEAARRTLNLVNELTDVYTKRQYPKWNRRKRKAKEQGRMKTTSAAA